MEANRILNMYLDKQESVARDAVIAAKAMYDRNIELIEKFLLIAYRKVTSVDAYGDENLEALEKEISIVICKIAEREGANPNMIKNIKKFVYVAELLLLKNQIETDFRNYYNNEKSTPITTDKYKDLNGTEFENYLMNLFRQKGYEVSGTPSTGDQGADLIVSKHDSKIAIQAKKYSGSVGNKAIQEVVSAKTYYSCDEAWVITNSKFTKSAIDLAQKCCVKLIDGHLLNLLHDNQ